MLENNIPSDSELWVLGVEGWLKHMERGFVERTLQAAIDNTSDLYQAIVWLQERGMGSIIGQAQYKAAGGLYWSVYTRLTDVVYLQIGWNGKLLIHTSLMSILEWLQAGKKRVPVQE